MTNFFVDIFVARSLLIKKSGGYTIVIRPLNIAKTVSL